MTYGTILVDLELRKPIEILADRTAETSEAWLRSHPEVEIVSRDRGGDYASAAKKGAPQAQQVADKFHLLQNLRERLKEVMDRKQSCLPEVEERASDAVPAKAQGIKDNRTRQIADPEKHYRTGSASPNQRSEGMRYDDFQKRSDETSASLTMRMCVLRGTRTEPESHRTETEAGSCDRQQICPGTGVS